MSCGGSGTVYDNATESCPHCGGSGRIPDFASNNSSISPNEKSEKPIKRRRRDPGQRDFIDQWFDRIPNRYLYILAIAGAVIGYSFHLYSQPPDPSPVLYTSVGAIAGLSLIPLLMLILKIAFAFLVIGLFAGAFYLVYLVLG